MWPVSSTRNRPAPKPSRASAKVAASGIFIALSLTGALGSRGRRSPPIEWKINFPSCGLGHRHRGCGERLVEVGDDIVDVLDADREAHVAGRHAAGELVRRAQLPVRGRSRMDGERPGIADVGHVVEEVERVDEARSGLAALHQLEANETAVAAPEV